MSIYMNEGHVEGYVIPFEIHYVCLSFQIYKISLFTNA